jgi:NAD-reducing hydrogenase small subunit
MGACAVNGGLPAQRNHLPLTTILEEVYHTSPGLANGMIPNDPELPLPQNKVTRSTRWFKVDYFIPGCPPSGDAIWKVHDRSAGRPRADS